MQTKMLQDEKVKALGIIAGGIVHEIGNCLNYMHYHTIYLQKKLAYDPDIKESIDDVDKGVNNITEITSNLRKFGSGGVKEIETFLLNRLIGSALTYAQDRTETIEVKNSIKEDIEAAGYPGELLHVFLNLITNASYALNSIEKEDKIIEVSCYKKNKKIQVSFKDNGPGIEEEKIKNIFTPFYTTKTTNKGMGLGLSICAQIIRNHGSELKVKSKLGEFTEFSFEAPCDAALIPDNETK
ncbi:MAG: HAMP domain-containing histidine kinase [Deltaproteobacteria bacterium]|nr:HAMP domain-containing histidine kinase [Deltaproteobacteria bacterium]